jgi:glycosyltransferase involved in cell wall biosynthesis
MLGGIRQHVIDIIENLDTNEYDIYLIYSDIRADQAFFEKKSELEKRATLICCNEMQREIGIHDIIAYKTIIKHIRNISPDIVHCHSSKAGIVGRLAAKKSHTPLIVYTPNAYAFESPDISVLKKNIYILAECLLSRFATSVTVNVSKGEMREALIHRIDKKEKFRLIYNGIPDIEIPEKDELKKELGLKQDVHYVGVTARCARQKDPMTFLDIAEKVVRECDNVEFIYIGDGEMMGRMKEFVKSHGLEKKVHLLGFRSDASRIVGVLDFYLSTALYEGLPYSVIEALRAGVTIIATDVVGNNDIVVNGKTGFIFPVYGSDFAKSIIIDQMSNPRIERDDIRLFYINRFSLETMISKLDKVYHNSIEGVI